MAKSVNLTILKVKKVSSSIGFGLCDFLMTNQMMDEYILTSFDRSDTTRASASRGIRSGTCASIPTPETEVRKMQNSESDQSDVAHKGGVEFGIERDIVVVNDVLNKQSNNIYVPICIVRYCKNSLFASAGLRYCIALYYCKNSLFLSFCRITILYCIVCMCPQYTPTVFRNTHLDSSARTKFPQHKQFVLLVEGDAHERVQIVVDLRGKN